MGSRPFGGRAALPLLFALTLASPAMGAGNVKDKEAAVAAIESRRPEMTSLSDEIWRYAETALRESRSSKALSDWIEKSGFRVERGVSGMPTAFVATYGSGKPVIAILAEFDALPGLSQEAVPMKKAREQGAAGHGCGHNLFGVASAAAGISLKGLIDSGRLKGTVRVYGTPAEEAIGGKIYMARDGQFKDVDAVLAWHPADRTRADMTPSQALVDVTVEFFGRSAHAAADPWNGRSAVDGVELFTHAVNMYREHIRPTSRMHYVIQNGGNVPNVVPDYGKVWIWMRDWKRDVVEEILGRMRKMAEGAAMSAGVESKLTINGGDWETLVNPPGERLLHQNLMWLGPIKYTEEEQTFAKAIQKETGLTQNGLRTDIDPIEGQEARGGSTDVGDVSWIAPTLHVSVTTAPADTPWHGWPVVACGGMSIGHKGMMQAAKVLAATAIDLLQDPKALADVQSDFREKTKGITYKPYIPEGPPPVPKQ
jgi:aminobenzoyl-glutamate utilization protein B